MSMNIPELLSALDWKPIPNCPGRYVQRPGISYLSPEMLAKSDTRAQEHPKDPPADTVVILPLDGGGLISYRKLDGSYRHTLNTEEGFQRKLGALGLRGSDSVL